MFNNLLPPAAVAGTAGIANGTASQAELWAPPITSAEWCIWYRDDVSGANPNPLYCP